MPDAPVFSERAHKVLSLSRDASLTLRHEYVCTEHLLLGLLSEGEGVACAVMQILTIDLEKVRSDVLAQLRPGRSNMQSPSELSWTSRAAQVLDLSVAEARDLNHRYVGTEHLLLGMLREELGLAAQVLRANGLSITTTREEILRLLGSTTPTNVTNQSSNNIVGVTVEILHTNGDTNRHTFDDAGAAIRFLHTQ